MIASIKKWFEQSRASNEAGSNDEQSVQLAALALLIETAKADNHFDENELNTVIELAEKNFKFDHHNHEELVALAKQTASESTSLYEFTSLIHETFSEELKFKLILGMWQVAYADGEIDRYEEHLIRKVAELIYVPHVRFIEAKHIASEGR